MVRGEAVPGGGKEYDIRVPSVRGSEVRIVKSLRRRVDGASAVSNEGQGRPQN